MGGKGSGKRDRYKRRKVMGLLGSVLESDIPTRVIGVAQRAEPVIPTACPHCHMGAPMWARSPWEGHCRCGTTIFRTIGETRFAAHRQRPPTYAAAARETP